MRFVMTVVEGSNYMLFSSVREAVGVVHRSRSGWCRGVAGIRRGSFLGGIRYVGRDYRIFCRYGSVLNWVIFVEFKCQVGLVVGVR